MLINFALIMIQLVTGELWEPGKYAERGRGRAAGGLGAGACCSRAAGGLVASGRATGGDGHGAGGNRVDTCGLGRQEDTGDKGTRRTQSVLRCRVQSKRRGSTPTIHMVDVRAKIRARTHTASVQG